MDMKRIRALVTGMAFLSTMGISSVLPILPSVAEAFSIAEGASGLIIAVFAIPGFFLIPLTGILADRLGRKAVLFPSLLLFALGGVACFFTTTFTQLLWARLIQGAGAASLGTLCSTITADTWTGRERAKMMGINGLMFGLGTAFSPALGGILGMLGWRFPFLLCLLAFPLAWYTWDIPLLRPVASSSLRSYCRTSWEYVKRPTSRLLLLLGFCTFIILSGPIVVCFPLFAKEAFQASPLDIGIIMALASLMSGIMASQLTRLYGTFSPRSLLVASQVLYLSSMLLMPFVTGLWWLILPIAFYGFGQGLNIPLMTTLMTGVAPDSQRGALMATNAMAHRFAQGLGPVLFGGFAAFLGAQKAIFIGALFALYMIYLSLRAVLPAEVHDNKEDEVRCS